MAEVGIAEYFSMAEALGIIATMVVVLYFSRKQMQVLSVDIETKILSDMDERIHELTKMGVERPELIRVINNVERDLSSDVA
jgi:DNA-binding transcriptional regulator YhcF (GntR family)